MGKKRKKSFEFRYYELPTDFPILALLGDAWVRKYEFGESLHFHGQLEIGYCYWGCGEMAIEDNIYEYREGDITFIPQYVPHSTQSANGLPSKWEYLFVDIEAMIKLLYPNTGWHIYNFTSQISSAAFFLHKEDFPLIGELVQKLFKEMKKENVYYKEYVKGLLMALFVEIIRLNTMEEIIIKPNVGQSNAVAPALEYLNRNYMKQIKVEELANMCHMSETHFRREFQNIMHMKPTEYINVLRIRMSCILLRSTDQSVLKIAISCGFPTITTFGRNFKKIMGTTPLKWRNTHEYSEKDLKNYRIMKLPGWL